MGSVFFMIIEHELHGDLMLANPDKTTLHQDRKTNQLTKLNSYEFLAVLVVQKVRKVVQKLQ